MLFAIRFPYKHCNFWLLCLPIKMAPQTVIRPIGGVLLNVIQAGLLTVSESEEEAEIPFW